MWVYMVTWIVQDGAPELGRGSYLPGVGLRADCRPTASAWARPGHRWMASRNWRIAPAATCMNSSDWPGLPGMCTPARGLRSGMPAEFVITTGDQAFIARTAGRASVVAAGSRFTAQCMLSVVADYEWDAFGLPDLRSDWYVRRLKIEHSQIDDVASDPGRALAGHSGMVLRTFEIENMSRRDDDRDSTIKAWYLLDLAPVQAS